MAAKMASFYIKIVSSETHIHVCNYTHKKGGWERVGEEEGEEDEGDVEIKRDTDMLITQHLSLTEIFLFSARQLFYTAQERIPERCVRRFYLNTKSKQRLS